MKATQNQEGYIVINGGRSWNKNLLYINRFNKKNIFTEKKNYISLLMGTLIAKHLFLII